VQYFSALRLELYDIEIELHRAHDLGRSDGFRRVALLEVLDRLVDVGENLSVLQRIVPVGFGYDFANAIDRADDEW
jgi:hypothetical protein